MNINDIPNQIIREFADYLDRNHLNKSLMQEILNRYNGLSRTHKIIAMAVSMTLRDSERYQFEALSKNLNVNSLTPQNIVNNNTFNNTFNAPVGSLQQGNEVANATVNMSDSIQTILDKIKPVLENPQPKEEVLPLLKELFSQLKTEVLEEFNKQTLKRKEVQDVTEELAGYQGDMQAQINAITEVLDEAVLQISQNQKPTSAVGELANWAGNVNTNVMANLIASPIYELIKQYFGVK